MRIKRENERKQMGRIGFVKIGEKVEKIKNGEKIEYPVSLDYFIAVGDYAEKFNTAFGEKPNSIEIIFVSDDEEISCNERLELRKGKKLFAYGDGKVFNVYSENTDRYDETSLGDEEIKSLEKMCDSKFQEVLTLKFIIPDIRTVFGFWQLTTKGEKSSIKQLVGVFDTIKEIAGTVRNIPFDLKVKKVVSQKPGSKNLFPVLSLIPNISQPHLEKVRGFMKAGIEFHGLMDEDKIDSLEQPKQIEDFTEVEAQIEDVFKPPIRIALEMIDNCKTNAELKATEGELRKLLKDMNKEEKIEADLHWKKADVKLK